MKNQKDIRDLVISSVRDGIEHEEPLIDISPFWYRNFFYHKDPLEIFHPEELFKEDLIKLFVDREAEIKIISGYFGKAKNFSYNLHIAIIGSKGIGKHTTVKIITKIIKESFPELTFEFYNLEFPYDYKNNISISEKKVNELDNRELDVRIISCSGRNKYLFLNRIKDYKENSRLTISIWHTRYYPFNHDLRVNKEIYFNNYSRIKIIDIFTRRIEKFLEHTKDSRQYYDTIINDVLPKIAESFQGNLNICFLFFKDLHQQALIMNLRTIPLELIENLIAKYLSIKNQKITTKEQEIIDYYLSLPHRIYVTTSDLKGDLDYDRTVAWKYLEKLTKKNIFKKIRYGNPSRYQMNELFLSFYEDKLRKPLVFKEKR